MKMWKVVLPLAAITLFAGAANAQSEEDRAKRAAEAQRELVEVRKAKEVREVELTARLLEAEERMEMAALEIAEITRERLPQLALIERRFEFSNKPRLGITIEGSGKVGPVEGVEIAGVTPESAADEAGLRAGDVITAVNDEAMTANSSMEANKLLLEFMDGVEEGDELLVEYLRHGSAGSVEVSPRVQESAAFSWIPDAEGLHFLNAPGLSYAPKSVEKIVGQFGFPFVGSAWGSMELVQLNEGLGKYFGTDTGLLVVKAPESGSIDLQDGDVIQSIDGREPKDVRHAMRILGSYQSGETLKLGIMRDKRKRTLDVAVPADQRGSLFAPPVAPSPVQPARVPASPAVAPVTQPSRSPVPPAAPAAAST